MLAPVLNAVAGGDEKYITNPDLPITIRMCCLWCSAISFERIGALITAGVLTAGLISFRQGNSNLGQKLMRARVVAQGATVALMVGTAYYYGEKF
ncbi:RING-H2 finger protein ATL48-like isoform X1 [Olea europaea var. sylvestris]|uniref:RING-H2 finger protein ATL48-like isoform X1 n=1 Tax=Olea europaea var. sylvestris TaxID=158386 RepID=UPI000C1CF613|nr:RING-H2 finger protein ATL48-like isoform X1 [Olea europaea var. sylvestris]